MRKNRCIWGALLAFIVSIGAAPAAQAADALTVVQTGVPDSTRTAIPADEYVMTFYEMGLLASPTAPAFVSDNLDLSSAVKVFESTGGVAVSIQNGVPSSLAGMISRPPDGTYHYAYAVIQPLITLRASARENSAAGTARYSTNNSTDTVYGTYFAAGDVSGVALEQSLTSFDGIAGNDMDNENSVGSGTLYSFLTEAPSGGIYPKGDATPTKLVGIFKIGGASGVVITSSSTTLNLSMNVSEGAQALIVDEEIVGFLSAPPSMTFDVR